MIYLWPFLIIIFVLVVVHELGHYWVARYNGVAVEVFSFGMGPKIFGFQDKNGTKWCISMFPLGGYVKFVGDANISSTKPADDLSDDLKGSSIFSKTPLQRIAISLGGPLANYIFSIILFAGMFAFIGERSFPPVVQSIQQESLAEKSGMMPNDVIISANDIFISDASVFKDVVDHSKSLDVVVRRGDDLLPIMIGPHDTLGITFTPPIYKQLGLFEALYEGARKVIVISGKTFNGVIAIFKGKTSNLSGPIGIAHRTGLIAKHMDMYNMLYYIALLSVSLGFFNLLPIPMLDGGAIASYLIELIRGKPLSQRVQEIFLTFGFILVLLLSAFAIVNDFINLSLISWFKGLIHNIIK